MRTPHSAAALLLTALCLAYAGDAGRGFIKDDFRWIRETVVRSPVDVARIFERTDGFYRPLVSLTFALNSAAFGLAPRPYGLTNLALVIASAALVWALARRLGLAGAPALLAAGVWAFNFHGINMAVLWTSGRTALVATLFALLTALAAIERRPLLAGLCCLLAMLSKEEAILLPLLVAAWIVYDSRGVMSEKALAAVTNAGPCLAALAIYLGLRMRTEAFWPGDAPSYYHLTFTPSMLAGNLLQYADRAVTWPAFAALATYAASAWQARSAALTASAASAGLVRFTAMEKRVVVFGAMWLACTFAITVFVPVRSSLYAVMPSVGAALAAGAVASAALRTAPQRATRALIALALLPLLLAPVYWRRNERWVRLADLSTSVLEQVRSIAQAQPGRPIVIFDNPSERFNLDAAFGNLWPDAAALFLPPGTNAVIAQDAPAASGAVILRLERGRLVRER